MKVCAPIFLLTAFLLADAKAAEVEAVDVKALAQLLKDIPRQDILYRYAELVKGREKAKTEEELADAKRVVERVKVAVPELRKLIKVGKSVFDYPGLLARGWVTFIGPPPPEYSVYIGVYLRIDQGREPYDFRIFFDGEGKITAVEDVIWKE